VVDADADGPEFDAALAGFLIVDHPAAAEIRDDWIERARWQRVVHVLRRHRDRGGTLGDIVTAATVLSAAGVDLPKTTAAEAVCATLDAAPAVYVVARGRERALRSRVRRLARILDTIAGIGIEQMPQYLDRIADDLQAFAEFSRFSAFSYGAPSSAPSFEALISQNLSNGE
jgi:hypothetical protein